MVGSIDSKRARLNVPAGSVTSRLRSSSAICITDTIRFFSFEAGKYFVKHGRDFSSTHRGGCLSEPAGFDAVPTTTQEENPGPASHAVDRIWRLHCMPWQGSATAYILTKRLACSASCNGIRTCKYMNSGDTNRQGRHHSLLRESPILTKVVDNTTINTVSN